MAIDITNITYIDYLWTRKNSDGTLNGIRLNKLNLPTNVALKDSNNSFTAPQFFLSPANVSGTEQSSVVVYTSNGGSIRLGKEGPNSGSMIRLDQQDGTCRLRFRSSATAGAMVWEQPENASTLYLDVYNVNFRKTTGVIFSNYKTADYLYTNDNGNLQKGTFKTLTIQKNGNNIATFKGNSNNTTANIEINTTDVNNSNSNVTGNTLNDILVNAKEIKSSDNSINISLVDGYIDFVVASAPITIKLNNAVTTAPVFYAPTSGGTSGYILKSNGTSAPSWISLSSITAGNASNASKVSNSLKIQANSGTTEGSNLYTFNGSTAKTINFKPSNDVFKVYGSTGSIYFGSDYIYLTSGNSLRDYINIDAPSLTYSMQIGDYGFTVDSGSPSESSANEMFSVNTDKMFYNGTATQISSLANSEYITTDSEGTLKSGNAKEISAGSGINIKLVNGKVEISNSLTSYISGKVTAKSAFTLKSGYLYLLMPTTTSASFKYGISSSSITTTNYGYIFVYYYNSAPIIRRFSSSTTLAVTTISNTTLYFDIQMLYIGFKIA